MDPVTAGAAGAAGSAFGSWMNYQAQQKTNKSNMEIAQQQMAFQERMSNSAHQREARDLEAAGLNRILGVSGSGASAPSGASANMVAPSIGNVVADGITSGVNMANMAKTLAETQNTLETNKVISEDLKNRQLTNARESRTLDFSVDKAAAESSTAWSESRKRSSESDIAETEAKFQRHDLGTRLERSNINREYNRVDKTIDTISNAIDGVTSALNVSKIFRPSDRSIKPGSKAERRALEKAGRKGLPLK